MPTLLRNLLPRHDDRAGTLKSWQISEMFSHAACTSVHKQRSGEVPWKAGERNHVTYSVGKSEVPPASYVPHFSC